MDELPIMLLQTIHSNLLFLFYEYNKKVVSKNKINKVL